MTGFRSIDRRICPSCSGKKMIEGQLCSRCQGQGSVIIEKCDGKLTEKVILME